MKIKTLLPKFVFDIADELKAEQLKHPRLTGFVVLAFDMFINGAQGIVFAIVFVPILLGLGSIMATLDRVMQYGFILGAAMAVAVFFMLVLMFEDGLFEAVYQAVTEYLETKD